MKLRYLFTTLFSIILLSGGWFFYLNKNEHKSLVSPVLGESKIAFADNVWFPKETKDFFIDPSIESQLSAQAAFFIETKTGEVLYQKNIHQKYSIASLIKIMTTIITLENRQMGDSLTVSRRAADMEPDKMLLLEGEKLTVEELLQGVFLISANDASEVLAEQVTGRREEFINLMNSKAQQLGMNNSYFLNPTGLEEDFEKQYSTAYDVALMSRYLIYKYPEVLNISSSPHIYIPITENHQDYDLYSGINLLTTYTGMVGLKTGFTPEAGLTLVTVARREGKEILGVLLGSVNRRDDAKLLLDYSFSKLDLEN